MSEMLVIRNKYQLWNDFIVPGIENGRKKEMIRAQLLDAIRKEVFDQMCWRLKVEDLSYAEHTPENEKIVESITRETKKKWRALIRLCDEHLVTLNLLSESDLEGLFDNSDEDEDDEEEFCEAEDPEEVPQ